VTAAQLPALPSAFRCFLQPDDSFGGGDVVHVAHSAYIHLLGITAIGQSVGDMMPQETVKVS
jgi:hypothetical protein